MENFTKNNLQNYAFQPQPPITVVFIGGEWDDYNTNLEIELSNGHSLNVVYKGNGGNSNLDVFQLKIYNSGDTLIYIDNRREEYFNLIGNHGSIEKAVLKMYEQFYIDNNGEQYC